MKRKMLIILLFGVIVLSLTGCDSKKDDENIQQETIDKYGFVEKETVKTLVAKFNTEVMDNSNGKLNPASDEYLTVENNQYWYGLVEGIYLVVIPIEFSNDQAKEVVDSMTIYVQKDCEYENDVTTYVKHLLNANNDKFTLDEVRSLMDEAVHKVNKEKANNGKGISLGYNDNTDNYQYLVKRLYKD